MLMGIFFDGPFSYYIRILVKQDMCVQVGIKGLIRYLSKLMPVDTSQVVS